MPQISKVRIVNFNYNDGNRLIADELYDFSSREKDDALNVLINLANGGGKSVLVQLMLQPIIPEAKVAGRKIESFFNKASDHCFVLLEWIKDNSTEKLLTGIAMAANEPSLPEEDSSRGITVKYYTFYSNYSAYTGEYDIVNMPLSKKENGRFVAAEFESVRALARKSNGALTYYVADDKAKWKKKLAEYGLEQSEWRMIEKLNSEEGGLSKFFGDFRRSDHLLDRFLIPAIEDKLKFTHSNEDSSLSTMLVSYAKQYASKQEIIEEKKTYEAFCKELEMLLPQAETLWHANYAFEESIRELFGFSDALAAADAECKCLQEKYASDIEQYEKKAEQIEYERASAEYYEKKEIFDAALRSYDELSAAENDLDGQLNDARHKKSVLECAGYHEKLLSIEGKLTAIQSDITRREMGGENGQEIAQLKYSVYVQIKELLSKKIPEAEQAERQCEEVALQKANCEKECKDAGIALDGAKNDYTRADERVRGAKEETDKEVEKYNIGISRRLDGIYADNDIADIKKECTNERTRLARSLDSMKKDLENIENEISSIPEKASDLRLARDKADSECKSIQRALSEYYEKEGKIKEICSEYNIRFATRFSNHIQESLLEEQEKNNAKKAECLRKISIAKEEIESAQRGSLHIPYAVIKYLNSTGVRYSTCEKYITDQVAEGKLSSEECLSILRKYPAAAYGVLMEPNEKAKFFDYGREKWLPAMIPLFTYEQMDQILKNVKSFDGAIAFYSEEYFDNVAQYVEKLEISRQALFKEHDLFDAIDAKIRKYLDVVKAFSYTEEYAEQQKSLIAGYEKTIADIDAQIQTLRDKKTTLTAARADAERKKEEILDAIAENNRVIEGIEAVLLRISTECDLEKDLHSKERVLKEAEQNQKKTQEQLSALIDQFTSIKQALVTLNKQISDWKDVEERIGECAVVEIREGDWRELYSTYDRLQSNLDKEMSELKAEFNENSSLKKEYEKEISRRELSPDDYTNISFSGDELDDLLKIEKDLEKQLPDARERAKEAAIRKGKAEDAHDHAKRALERFGAPLDKSEVGGDFDNRLAQVDKDKRATAKEKERCEKQEIKIHNTFSRLNDRMKTHTRPTAVIKVVLEDSLDNQFARMAEGYDSLKEKLGDAHRQVIDALNATKQRFAGSTCGVSDAISGMASLLSNELRGDRYYTLTEHIRGAVQNTERAISRISTDLKEFENTHNDLVRQCVLQGERIYAGLLQMASSSRVTIYDDKAKKQMIRFDIPWEVDPVVASNFVSAEIDKGTKELVAKMSNDDATEIEIKKLADKIVGSKNLLRKYIGKETIRVDAYKIDQNPQNAGYRSWEQTQVNNSGAEKFVVYFAVILALMNYTRGNLGGLCNKDLRSALILDNPFGATSSKHILDPMFAIARHFRVQMICLSDINKSDVINCFDVVIRAVIKRISMSNKEVLTHDGNELIEHGFFRSEQQSAL